MSRQSISMPGVIHPNKVSGKLRPSSLKGLVLPLSVALGYTLHQLLTYWKRLEAPASSRLEQSSMKLDNRAAYLCAPCLDVEVRAAPYTEPDEYEIVIRNHAVAINPVNWIKQHAGDGFAPWVKYPFVLGNDVAGEVVQVGAKVTSFHIGDRVLGHAVGMSQKVNRPAEGAFQLYTVLRSHMASHIPDSVSYDKACVVPLGLSTASQCLFSKAFLALPLPTVPQGEGSRDGKQGTIVVWGGSSSVGCNAIQLAIAAGLRVITTASPHNHSLMKQLGADAVFDYSSPTIVEDLAASVNSYPGDLVGILPISNGSLGECVDLMLSVTSTAPHRKHRKFICQFSSDLPKAGFRRGSTEWPTIDGVAMTSTERAKAAGIEVKFVIGSDIMHDPIVSKGIYGQFLLQALAEGTFVPAPEPLVVGNGLEYVQEALDLNRKGVSARKVVVCL